MNNIMLSLEKMTMGQMQLLIEKENRRKAQCAAAYKRWLAKNKETGELIEKRKLYNARAKSKFRGKSSEAADLDDFPGDLPTDSGASEPPSVKN